MADQNPASGLPTAGSTMSLLRALHHRPFAAVWAAHTITLLGDRVFQVTLAWWVLEETGSAVAMSMVFVLTMAPMLVFLLIGGAAVDRFPRVGLLLGSDVLRGFAMIAMATLAWRGSLSISHIYAFSLISGFVEAFFQPAFRAIVPDITPSEHLPSANSLTSLSGQMTGILGPAFGAALLALGGAPLGFALDALSFLLSAALLLPVFQLCPVAPQPRAENSRLHANIVEGLAAVRASPWLWVTIAVAGVSNIAYAGPMDVLVPFLIRDQHSAGVGLLGLFHSASSVGSIVAAWLMGRLRSLRRRGRLLYGSWMVIGVCVAALGLPTPIPAVLLASLLIGACNTTLGLAWISSLQEHVPSHLLGRVTSVDYLGSYILLPLGYGIGGWASTRFGTPTVFVVGGLLQTLLIALGLLHPQVRGMD